MTTQLPVPLPTLPPSAPQGGSGNKVWRLVIGVIAVVLAVVVVGVVLVNRTSAPPTPKTVHLVGRTAVTVTIAWQPGSSKSPGVFNVYRNNARVTTVAGTVTQFRDVGLVPSTTYAYRVSAQTSGHESAKSDPLTVRTLAGSLATARLTGSYDVHLRITSESGYTSLSAGHVEDVSWSFSALSGNRTKLSGTSWAGDGWVMTLNQSGRTFRGHTTEAISKCYITPVETTVSVVLNVSAAAAVDATWAATKFAGTLTQVAPRTVSALHLCPGARFTASVSGTLHR